MRIIKLFSHILKELPLVNRSIYRSVLISLICIVNIGSISIAADLVMHQNQKNDPNKPAAPKELKRIEEVGGEVVIDGSLRVLEPVMGKVFDLVEVSTPVTPATNHARVFLRADGAKQSLVIIFDDGTTTKIVGN